MKKIGHIYLILFANGCKYVGQTTDLKDRKRRYKRHDCKQQQKLYAHLEKYKFKSCKFILLEDVLDLDTICEREIFWIKKLNTFSGLNKKHGLNLTMGGEGTRGVMVSPEERKKRSERTRGENNPNYGVKHTDEVKLLLSRKMKGNKIWLGRKHSPEAIEKNRLSHIGRVAHNKGIKMKASQKQKLSEIKSSLIIDTFTGVYYLGIKEAAFAKGININTLKGWLYGKCKNGKNKSTLQYA